jgi:NADH-quinone oxidoreductase subunit A
MPSTFPQIYWPVLVQILIAATVAGFMIGMSALLGKRVHNKAKDTPYECGVTPQGSARERFSVKFYLVAMIFIPWAVVFRELKLFAFIEMFLFVVLILSGFFYVLKKGALDWSESNQAGSGR